MLQRPRTTLLLTLGLVVTIGTVVACGDDGEDGPDAAELLGTTTWIVVGGDVDDQPIDPIATHPVTFAIGDDGTVSGTAACNGYGGTVELDGGSVTIGRLAVTEMACLEDGVMELESLVLEALGRVEEVEAADDGVALVGDGVRVVMEPAPPTEESALIGTTWVLESLLDGATATGFAGDEDVDLVLADDGTLTGSTGCNRLTGSYELDGDRLVTGPLATTQRACEPDLTEVEALVLEVLGSRPLADVVDDQLSLVTDDGRGLGYRAR